MPMRTAWLVLMRVRYRMGPRVCKGKARSSGRRSRTFIGGVKAGSPTISGPPSERGMDCATVNLGIHRFGPPIGPQGEQYGSPSFSTRHLGYGRVGRSECLRAKGRLEGGNCRSVEVE